MNNAKVYIAEGEYSIPELIECGFVPFVPNRDLGLEYNLPWLSLCDVVLGDYEAISSHEDMYEELERAYELGIRVCPSLGVLLCWAWT
jgi:hypothetical protein